MDRPTLHILSSPNKPVRLENRTDPFSVAVVKFVINMEKLGYRCIAYTVPGSEVPCQSVICLDHINSDTGPNIQQYNQRAGSEIAQRKNPGDFILCFHGWENKGAAEANPDLRIVEPSIGYDITAVFAPYRVFTSYAQMHMFYGHKNMLLNPSWFDAVIPNAFTSSEFTYDNHKEDYFLIFGRIIENKGIHIAIQATQATGQKLVIAGPGSLKDLGYTSMPPHVECVGICDWQQRRSLMSKAKAILGPTYYVEPFGNMVVEGYFSGTPAITTDWGGFIDTVVPGVTGYRCREFKEFLEAIDRIQEIKSQDCLRFAMDNYEETVVHRKFDQYFLKLRDSDFYRR